MKSTSLFSPHLFIKRLSALVAIGTLLIQPSVQGANLFWDGTDTTANADGGNGTWNTTLTNWDTLATAGTNSVWTNANNDTAIFSGTAATVSLGTGIQVGGLQFDTSGYIVTANTLTFGAAGNIVTNADARINSTIAGSVAITKTGAGTLTLGSTIINSFTGPLNVNEGILKAANNNQFGNNGVVLTIASGAKVDLSGFATQGNHWTGAGEIINTSTNAGQIGVRGALTFTGNVNQTSGAIGFNVQAAANQTFSGTNNSTGAIAMNNGKLTVAQLVNSSVGNITFNGPTSSTFIYNGSANASAGSRNIAISGASGSGIIESAGAGTLTLGTASLTAAGAKTLTLQGVNAGANTMGAISNGSDTLSLTKSGTGKWVLAGVNSYTGNTTINTSGGTLEIGGAGQLGSGSYGGTIAVGASSTFSYASSANQTLTNVVSGSGALSKSGASTLALTGANTYSGGTTVSAGALEVNNTSGSGTGSGTVTVNGTLAGEGSITSSAGNYVYLNGTLQVGSLGATQGTDFSITTSGGGSTVLGASSVTRFDLWNSASGDQSGNLAAADMLRLFGDFSITSGASLVLNNPNSRSFMAGDVFKLFDWAGLGTLTGTYGSIDSSSLGLGGLTLDTSNLYTLGTISIMSIPEPSRALLLMTGFFGLMLRRRRVGSAA
ncbi:MAG: autotransporter-associated beta strand repeat-containing protein [Verrucomicrobia bacterium]|nr:autotransporter-associated beta strand repeat-containing protein [Verrucomicrobiota bacterium]